MLRVFLNELRNKFYDNMNNESGLIAYGKMGAIVGGVKGIFSSISDAAPTWENIFQTFILALVGSITAMLFKWLRSKFFTKKSKHDPYS